MRPFKSTIKYQLYARADNEIYASVTYGNVNQIFVPPAAPQCSGRGGLKIGKSFFPQIYN